MPTRRHPRRPAKSKATKPPHIHRWMRMEEIASLHPAMAGVLAAYGLHCVGCAYSTVETLEEGALAHGLSDDDVSALLIDLEEARMSPIPTPAALIVTEAAAHALQAIVVREDKEGWSLSVTTDEAGNFCMEFSELPPGQDDVTVSHPAAPSLCITASPATLARIGGATIDYRDGRFKLDLARTASCPCSTHDNHPHTT